jgi:hypothetical protein
MSDGRGVCQACFFPNREWERRHLPISPIQNTLGNQAEKKFVTKRQSVNLIKVLLPISWEKRGGPPQKKAGWIRGFKDSSGCFLMISSVLNAVFQSLEVYPVFARKWNFK